MTDETFLIVTTMKNEGPFMIDWVAYNRSIGFDDILIFTNDCDDGTDAIAERMQELGWVHHERNPVGPKEKPQTVAFSKARSHSSYLASDWILSLDVDEYINVRVPGGDIRSFVAASGDADAISMCWRMFGQGGQNDFVNRPVPETFFRAAPEDKYPHQRAKGFKTLFRNNGKFNRFRAHRPRIDAKHAIDPDAPYQGVLWRDSGGNLFPADQVKWRAWRGFSHDYARIHHYAVRSTDSFLVKRDRGRTNHISQDQGLEYWKMMNHNHVEDRSILGHMPKMHKIRAEIMNDARLAELHDDACAWHLSKAKNLRARSDWADFVNVLQNTEVEAKPVANPVTATVRRGKRAKQRERKDGLRRELLELMPKGKLSIEIGVWKGEFSQILLEGLRPSKLFLIDPWGVQEDPEDGVSLAGARSKKDMDRIYESVKNNYKDEIARGKIAVIRDFSVPAMDQFKDGSIGFAYVDGDHSYEGVKADLKAILPKMQTGGVIMLDDYHRKGWWKDGVMRAFHEFLGENAANLRIKAIKGAQVAVQKI
ncbi:glycosyltransferase family 2 protein [Ruegeria arenilitoris]|uniref:glycosyltransferase family 2 protein n=1 Tax=Ruegeria arenilitoris TaxID=1173585 RepID=UPI0020C2BA69|nr:glycosyltransferase family 2 protein [Ruegeria arenilitoris]